MKKSLIAASASAVALAAMPVIGVFAAPNTVDNEIVDTLNVTVDKGCTFNNEGTRNATADFGTMTPGQFDTRSTDAINITCNDAWTLTVKGTNLTGGSGTTPISSTSAAVDGTVSNYKLTLAPASATGITTNNFGNAKEVSSATSGETAIIGSTVSALDVTPTYTLSIGAGQEKGTYSGTVTYTVAAN